MDREELIEWMKEGTVRITMNSGDQSDLVAGETALVTSMAVHALVRSDDRYAANEGLSVSRN